MAQASATTVAAFTGDLPIDRAAMQELAPGGVLRAAINLGNTVLAQRDPASGALGGVAVELAGALAGWLGVTLVPVLYDAAGEVVKALADGAWDVGFLAIDPLRSEQLRFTAPYVLVEGNYMVRSDSPLLHPSQVDAEGVRVAVGAGSAYDLFLRRSLKCAQLLPFPTTAAAFAQFAAQGLEAAAGVRQVVRQHVDTHAGLRTLEPCFMTIAQAMCVPGDRAAGAALLSGFVERAKASGFVGAALLRSGQDAAVPPALA